jgi:hypothetical protein
MVGVMEEMNAWGTAEDDEIRLNRSSIASAAIKILLFETEVNQVAVKITVCGKH